MSYRGRGGELLKGWENSFIYSEKLGINEMADTSLESSHI